MQPIVTKFGGTSVSSRETWDRIADITRQHRAAGRQPILVCSAKAGISNQLDAAVDAAILGQHANIEAAIIASHQALAEALEVPIALLDTALSSLNQWLTGIAFLAEAPPKIRAQVMSLGELMLTRLGCAFLKNQGLPIQWVDVRTLLTSTPATLPGSDTVNYLSARCESAPDADWRSQCGVDATDSIITQGFFVANPEGETVLLGRGGSDTSAALLSVLVGAVTCEIWTDVPGIYTANPHQLPQARLLAQLNYDEAQEIASMGAKVLHPHCLPPVRQAGIPMWVKFTQNPAHEGTRISIQADEVGSIIKSIQVKHSITLISIDTLNMWQQVGFLADVFGAFKQHGFSVDLLSSSEFNVTVSLDVREKWHDRRALDALLVTLSAFGRARVIEPCSAVSLVGRHIRTVLPQLGPALALFEAKQIYLMSLASNDLNLTFVVDESCAEKLCQSLHALLIEEMPVPIRVKTWQEEFGPPIVRSMPWWETRREALLTLASTHTPCYVYDTATQQAQADKLLSMQSLDAVFYALKANAHPDILRTFEAKGLGFECVSIQELQRVLSLFPTIDKTRLLFTPNFAPEAEYAEAMALGCHVTIDSLYPLMHWPELFEGRSIFLRIDPGSGAGHHKFVSTAGNESKFGIVKDDLPIACERIKTLGIKVVGLHAHAGSGILSPALWPSTAQLLSELLTEFPQVRVLNLGGGLGVVDKPGQTPLDIPALDEALMVIKNQYPKIALWLEPGRYLVAESGVILAKVTQCKQKGTVNFIGIETGMNSLIRPALYGAYHDIVNLTRLTEEKTAVAHVVGPICESGDTLGYGRLLPPTQAGDVLLIANTGAYGFSMSSHYNLRAPAPELILHD